MIDSSWCPKVYKRVAISLETMHHARNEREWFTIAKYHYFEYTQAKKETVRVSKFVRAPEIQTLQTFVLKKTNDIVIPTAKAYPQGKVPFKASKIEDLKKVFTYILDEHQDFLQRNLPVAYHYRCYSR
ncbi:hypothetical protein ANN_19093 [Periplaneta americana]|uniref:Uncharacterized protein n=1 Tax=Periplaneta americana TaxID=6978 RepID=A0ABQ8SRW1_PERAM|nr:hypothetical protein ANN_19093 [Periplaneta americana]